MTKLSCDLAARELPMTLDVVLEHYAIY